MAQTATVTAEKVDERSDGGQNLAGGVSSEIQEAEEKLFMVDQGFNAEEIMNSKLFKMNMSMLEDETLREDLTPNPQVPEQCQLMYKKLVLRLSAFYVNA